MKKLIALVCLLLVGVGIGFAQSTAGTASLLARGSALPTLPCKDGAVFSKTSTPERGLHECQLAVWVYLGAASGEVDSFTPLSGTKTVNGNLIVTGILQVAGQWQVESTVPGSALSVAGAGASKIGFDSDGKVKVSENAGPITELAKVGTVLGVGDVSGATGSAFCKDGTGRATTIGCAGGSSYSNLIGGTDLLEMYNGTSAQTFNIYNTRTDASNYERLSLHYDSGAGAFALDSYKLGTGTYRAILFRTGNVGRFQITPSGHLLPYTNNTYDLCSSGAMCRSIYVGTTIVSPQYATSLVSTAALTIGQPVKADTANANQIVVTTTADTDSGIVLGVVANAPGVGAAGYVVQSGIVSMVLGTGTCSIGQFVIVDTTTNGRVKCTSTFTAGTIIGKALSAQASVGSAFNTLIGLR